MATNKKKTSKKTSSKKGGSKKRGKSGGKKVRRKVGKGSVTFFMGQLIVAGYLGDELPESAKEQGRAAMRLRQMAEKLSRQTGRFGDEDVGLGGGAAPEDEESEDGEE